MVLYFQLVITYGCNTVWPGTAALRQPHSLEPYVEQSCILQATEILLFLGFDLILLILCAGFGFLTRQLPANFNESRFMFASVATTMLLWIIILPTYLSAFYALHQTALLACCLLLNAYITLVCLFLPKLYAVYFISEDNLAIATSTGVTGMSASAHNT